MSILRSPELLLNVTGNFCDRNLGPNDEAVGSGEAVGFMAWFLLEKKESNNGKSEKNVAGISFFEKKIIADHKRI